MLFNLLPISSFYLLSFLSSCLRPSVCSRLLSFHLPYSSPQLLSIATKSLSSISPSSYLLTSLVFASLVCLISSLPHQTTISTPNIQPQNSIPTSTTPNHQSQTMSPDPVPDPLRPTPTPTPRTQNPPSTPCSDRSWRSPSKNAPSLEPKQVQLASSMMDKQKTSEPWKRQRQVSR